MSGTESMELITGKLLGFVMVLTRISAFFMVLPVFGWNGIPVRVKIAVVIVLAIFFSMVTPLAIESKNDSIFEAMLLVTNEALYGLALGIVFTIVFGVVRFAGQIIERQMGLAMAEILDPFTDESEQPLASLLEMIFIILFLSANGHHLFLSIVSKSYEAFPAGSIPTATVLAGGMIKAGSIMLTMGLKLAAPILAAFLLLMVILAVLARVVPEMDVLFTSFPLSVGLGLLMTAIFLPFINGFVAELADLMGRLLPL
jgi:flagellar biosynthetic protein FliR